MTIELLAMLGGSVSGFIMKLIATQAEAQGRALEAMIQQIGRAFFAIVVAPFVFAFTDVGVTVGRETNGFLGLFKTLRWDTLQGFVILPEVRQTALAIVGFYFGSSQVK